MRWEQGELNFACRVCFLGERNRFCERPPAGITVRTSDGCRLGESKIHTYTCNIKFISLTDANAHACLRALTNFKLLVHSIIVSSTQPGTQPSSMDWSNLRKEIKLKDQAVYPLTRICPKRCENKPSMQSMWSRSGLIGMPSVDKNLPKYHTEAVVPISLPYFSYMNTFNIGIHDIIFALHNASFSTRWTQTQVKDSWWMNESVDDLHKSIVDLHCTIDMQVNEPMITTTSKSGVPWCTYATINSERNKSFLFTNERNPQRLQEWIIEEALIADHLLWIIHDHLGSCDTLILHYNQRQGKESSTIFPAHQRIESEK